VTRLDLDAMIRAAQAQGKAVAWFTRPDGVTVAVAMWRAEKEKK